MRAETAYRRFIFLVLTFLTLTIFSCAQVPNGPTGSWGHMMGFGYGGEYMWLFVLVLVSVVVFFLFQISKSKGFNGSIVETPIDILKRRYAKGDIDKEEFDRMKGEL